MTQNQYDQEDFFRQYNAMPRSREGLQARRGMASACTALPTP